MKKYDDLDRAESLPAKDGKKKWKWFAAAIALGSVGFVAWSQGQNGGAKNVPSRKTTTRRSSGPQVSKVWTAQLGSGVEMDFMPIAAGSFQMGSNSGSDDETPVHRVTLSKPFWLAKTEVTQAEFRRFVSDAGYQTQSEKQGYAWVLDGDRREKGAGRKWDNVFAGSNRPVTCVSWDDSMEFCRWLTQKERQAGRLPEGF